MFIDSGLCNIDSLIQILNQTKLIHTEHIKTYSALFNVSEDTERRLIERYDSWYLFRGIFRIGYPINMIIRGLDEIISDGFWLPRNLLHNNIEKNNPYIGNTNNSNNKIQNILTPKEVAILDRICNGMSNTEVAEVMFISQNTVKAHLYNIFKKLHVKNRIQAANWYKENIM
jgi:LuxR family transcriptional regulator of csgAB operon